MINFLKNKFILIIIFCVAIYFRVNAYLINNSFFTDEVLLALNVLNRNFIELIQPLNYFQSAPYLFLIMTKIVVSVTGAIPTETGFTVQPEIIATPTIVNDHSFIFPIIKKYVKAANIVNAIVYFKLLKKLP